MILERVGAPVFGVMTAAIVAVPKPTVWFFLGYPFEVASLIGALFAALVTRLIIGMRAKSIGKALDWAVLALVLATTAVIVIGLHASLIPAFLYGTGLAVLGEGILKVAERYTEKGLAVLGIAPPPPASPSDAEAIEQAVRELDKIP